MVRVEEGSGGVDYGLNGHKDLVKDLLRYHALPVEEANGSNNSSDGFASVIKKTTVFDVYTGRPLVSVTTEGGVTKEIRVKGKVIFPKKSKKKR